MKFFFILFLFFFSHYSISKELDKNFMEGEKKYLNKNYKEAKIFFEKNIIFNTKNINSYLYLSKIHQKLNNLEEEAKNLKVVIMLNPKHEEALYLITELYIKQGDFELAKKNYDLLKVICQKKCDKLFNLQSLILKTKD